jgi:hypothetical protein
MSNIEVILLCTALKVFITSFSLLNLHLSNELERDRLGRFGTGGGDEKCVQNFGWKT